MRASNHRQHGDVQAILFADLCGFTEYTLRYGDERAADLAVSFHHNMHALAAVAGCRVVKEIGDAVMVHSSECAAAFRLACRILALADGPDHPPVRVGLDIGPAVERDGDWYGTTVNAAARVTDAAGPGEFLLTERAGRAVVAEASVRLESRGLRHLKGLQAVQLQAALVGRKPASLGIAA